MASRLLLILALVAPQVWLPALVTSARDAACLATSCCAVVETVSCCGRTATERVCHQTDGVCRCAGEADESAPAPLRRATERPTDTVFLAAACERLRAAVAIGRTIARAPEPPTIASKATQAILCIWRT